MGQVTERLGQRPLRQRVGRKALVENDNRRFHGTVAQVREEHRQIHRHHQAFVRHHRGGQGADVEVAVVLDGFFRMATGKEQPTVQLLLGVAVCRHHHLPEPRQGRTSQITQAGRVGGHFAPAEHRNTLGLQGRIDSAFLLLGLIRVRVGKYHPHAVVIRQRNGLLFRDLAEERIGFLKQQTAAITGFSVGINAAPVCHARKCFNSSLQKLVAGLALHMGNQTKTTVVPEFSGLSEPPHQR